MLLHLSFFTLFACEGAEQICHKKLQDSQLSQSEIFSIPVKNKKRLLYSKQAPKEKIFKHDPFLGLYLVADSSGFAYPFEMTKQLKLPLYSVDSKKASSVQRVRKQLGLNHLARFDRQGEPNAIITNSCCALEAVVTKRGAIEKEYLERFLSNKAVEYGDIGLRLEMNSERSIVFAVDPFFDNNPFREGDQLLAFDGKRVTPAGFMREILFSKIASKHSILLKRDGAALHVDVVVRKRHGGGELSDTFLESKGIFFDKNLQIISLKEQGEDLGLRKGDRLLQVNTKHVQTQEQVRHYLGDFKEHASLLFERENFEFFINIK